MTDLCECKALEAQVEHLHAQNEELRILLRKVRGQDSLSADDALLDAGMQITREMENNYRLNNENFRLREILQEFLDEIKYSNPEVRFKIITAMQGTQKRVFIPRESRCISVDHSMWFEKKHLTQEEWLVYLEDSYLELENKIKLQEVEGVINEKSKTSNTSSS